MNRAVSLFVVFCLLMLCLGFAISWWLGPQLVSLAFDSQRAKTPFFGLYLQHQVSDAQAEDPQALGYKVRLLQMLAHPSDSGTNPVQADAQADPAAEVLWQYSSVDVVVGKVDDAWSNLTLARFGTGRQFVRLATSPEYRAVRDAAPKGRRMVVGSSTRPLQALQAQQHSAAMLLLVAGAPQQALDAWVDQLVALGGEVIWDAPAAVLEPADAGPASWDSLVLITFANAQALNTWAFSVEAQTVNALLAAQVEVMNLWLLQDLR